MGEIVQALAAEHDAGDAGAAVYALLRIVDHASLHQRGDLIADRARVHAQVAPVGECGEYDFRQGSQAELQRRTVFDQAGDVARDRQLGRARLRVHELERRAAAAHDVVEVGLEHGPLAAGPRRLLVHFGDDHARGFQRRDEVFVCDRQAVFAAFVRRRNLQQQHVHLQPAACDQIAQMRVMAGQDVEFAGFGECAVGAGAGVSRKADAVGVFGFQRVGIGDTEEHLEIAYGVALRHQRLGERQRLGIRLAPHHRVAGADEGAEIQRVQFEFFAQGGSIKSLVPDSQAAHRRVTSTCQKLEGANGKRHEIAGHGPVLG